MVSIIFFIVIYKKKKNKKLDPNIVSEYVEPNIVSKYVASNSLFNICIHKAELRKSEMTDLPKTYPNKDGDTIYITTTALPNFVINYLPNIKNMFILVSGDSDYTIPDDYKNETNVILNNKYLIKWYSQNCNLIDSKLVQLPIGLDYHTLLYRPLWGSLQSIIQQENNISNILKIKTNKKNLCYGNFHFNIQTNDRVDALKKISKDIIYYEPTQIPRIETWNNMIKYKYIISPHGNGLDCHRTWESIILGCIPIVKTSVLDSMYDGLPVLIVNDWSDITAELLDTFKPNYKNIEKIYMTYWIDEFNKYKI